MMIRGQAVDERRMKGTGVPTCLVLMPFSGEFKEIYEAAIRPAIVAAGFIERSVDQVPVGSPVSAGIQQLIRGSDVIIADVSSGNPNVYFEIGIATGFSKDFLIVTQNTEQIPFDLRQFLVLKYSYDPAGVSQLRQKLADSLRQLRIRGLASRTGGRLPHEPAPEELIANLRSEISQLRKLLSQRERELEDLSKARPGLDELLYLQQSMKEEMSAFLEETASGLNRSLAEAKIEITRLETENEALRGIQEQVGDIRSKMLVNPHWPIHDQIVEDDLVFVLMPFSESWSDDVWILLQQIVENQCGMRCRRADMEIGRVIMHDI